MLQRTLLAAALAAFVMVPVGHAYVPVSSDLGPAKAYPSWPVLTAEMSALASEFKDIARLHSAGVSSKGMDLWYMEIADFENPDRIPLSAREVVYIDGGTHANEYIGVIFVMHVLRTLLRGYGSDETATWIVENRHTIILPLVNPDGSVNGVGRLNGNLVNINRNYPVGWGDVNELPVVNNPGPHPASESETRAVMGVWERYDPDYVASIHCCGNLWLYPYGMEGRDPHPDDHAVFERICDEVLADVRDSCGPIWSTIYPASGTTTDTGYELFGANSWGFEMSGRERSGFVWGPPVYTTPIEELEKESWRAIFHAFLNVEKYGAHPVAEVASVANGALTLVVRNDGWGNLSRGAIEVVDRAGMVRTARLPALAAGDETRVTIQGSFGAGEFPVQLSYQKRPLDAKIGVTNLALLVTSTASGLSASLASAAGGLPLSPASVSPESEGEPASASVPGFEAFAALAAVGVALLAARRRRPGF